MDPDPPKDPAGVVERTEGQILGLLPRGQGAAGQGDGAGYLPGPDHRGTYAARKILSENSENDGNLKLSVAK